MCAEEARVRSGGAVVSPIRNGAANHGARHGMTLLGGGGVCDLCDLVGGCDFGLAFAGTIGSVSVFVEGGCHRAVYCSAL